MREQLSREEFFSKLATRLVELSAFSLTDLEANGFVGETQTDIVLDWLKYEYGGAPNLFLAELYEFMFQKPVTVYGEPIDLFSCKCCGFKTLTEPNQYDICRWCGWEDDGEVDSTVFKAINQGSMNDYRKRLKETDRMSLFHRWLR